MISLISFLIVIGICVISHEGGHFLAARFRGVLVHEFSFGMGPELWHRKTGETQYSFRAFPIGGYVKLEGEDAGDESEPSVPCCDPSRSLANKKPWERILILGAGAAVNIALAWLLTAFYLSGHGAYDMSAPQLGNIMENTPAYTAGLQSGDVIKSIDGKPLDRWVDIQKTLRSESKVGDEFDIVISRDGKDQKLSINIPYSEEAGGRLLGVQPPYRKYPIIRALGVSFSYSWSRSISILRSLWLAVTGRIAVDVTGPVGIAVMAGDALAAGFWSFLGFLGVINLNLGLLNLLPFPALDGGRIVFVLIEVVTRRKVPERAESIIHYGGFIVLIALIALVTGKDIFRLFLSNL